MGGGGTKFTWPMAVWGCPCQGLEHVAAAEWPCHLWNPETPVCLNDQEGQEQGQGELKAYIPLLEEGRAEGTCLSFLSSSGWDSAQVGEGTASLPLPLSSCCFPSHPLQLSRLHQSHPRLDGRRGLREEGPPGHVWLR